MDKIIKDLLHEAIVNLVDIKIDDIEIEIPSEEAFGDFATPIAMRLAKNLKRPPRKIAEEILTKINDSGIFNKIEIAGPGYINFTYNRDFIIEEIKRLLANKEQYFFEDLGQDRRVQIEFVSANPTGPLHLGHGRGAAIGAALANLLQFAGYRVVKEYYINDAGRQVQLLGLSVLARYKQLKGEDCPIPEDGYMGDYVIDIAKDLIKSGIDESQIEETAYKKILNDIKSDLTTFGIDFDSWQSEKEMYRNNEVSKSISELRQKGLVYQKDGANWFSSTLFGDDKDRVITKSDGEFTYFASDIAYHRKKVESGYDEIIDIWGADHHGYIPRIKAVIQAFGYPQDKLKVLLVQMVSLKRNGLPVQMSKRSGEFITLKEIIDEIGSDTTKFLFLTRRHDSHLEIDIEIAKKQSHENPVYYVQYAHARIKSIFEKYYNQLESNGNEYISTFEHNLFNDDEVQLLKKVLTYKMVLKNAAFAREPHRITFFLQELASLFHTYYQKYRVISDNQELTKTRLALCHSIGIVISHGLKILGVNAPERM